MGRVWDLHVAKYGGVHDVASEGMAKQMQIASNVAWKRKSDFETDDEYRIRMMVCCPPKLGFIIHV